MTDEPWFHKDFLAFLVGIYQITKPKKLIKEPKSLDLCTGQGSLIIIK